MKPTIADILNNVKLNTIVIMDENNNETIFDTNTLTREFLTKEVSGFVFNGFREVRVWLRRSE